MKTSAPSRQRLLFGGLALIYLALLVGLSISAPYLAVIPLFVLVGIVLRAAFFEIMRLRFWPPQLWIMLVPLILDGFLIFYGAWGSRLSGPFLWCLLAHIPFLNAWDLIVLNTHLQNQTVRAVKNQSLVVGVGMALLVGAGALLVVQALHLITYAVMLYVLGCAGVPLALAYWSGIIFYKKHDSSHSQYQYAVT